ncbi:MAG: putative glycoside hydrolase [Chloroflexota bacterium]
MSGLTRHATLLLGVLALVAGCTQNGLPFVPTPEPTPELPREVAITVVDRSTREPIAGAFVEAGAERVLTDESGDATFIAMRGSTVSVSAAEHEPGSAEVPDEGPVEAELRPNVLRGSVTDEAGAPLADVRVFVDGTDAMVLTDATGAYELPGIPEAGTVIFKRAGHRLGEIPIGEDVAMDVALERFEARALYAPASVFESTGGLEELLELVDSTEVNALVIDVKETDGLLYYSTDLPEAVEVGAVRETPILDLEELLPMLRARGIYTIARMVVMKDNTVTAARPELAVRNVVTGEPWRDYIGGAWLDPSAPGVAEYVAAIAVDLADKGFDEVQLDYVRFFSDGPYAEADTTLPNSQSFRLAAMQRVLRVVSEAMATKRAFLAADVFPISFILPDDQGIGQRPEVVMPYVDYACPMAYPSHFGSGVFGLAVPNNFPYEVVDQTLEIMNEQAAEWPVALRPWIQDFGYGEFPKYTPEQVAAQIQAATDRSAHGWMVWNPITNFSASAFGPPRPGEDAGPVTEALPAPSTAP